MKRFRFAAVAVMLGTLAAACPAQSMPSEPTRGQSRAEEDQAPPGTHPLGIASSRAQFGIWCGIADSDPESAVRLSRSPEGEWSVVESGGHAGPRDNAAARVWRESNWMVDLHDTPGAIIHTGQMCFDADGQLRLQIDRYMDVPGCECLRLTVQTFDASGKIVAQDKMFVRAGTGAEIAVPEAAKGFPEVYRFRRVEQLPFYSLVEK